MQIAIWVFVWLIMAYLIGQLAYRKGRQDKWEELSTDYICIHKSVGITPLAKRGKKAGIRAKNPLTKSRKKDTINYLVGPKPLPTGIHNILSVPPGPLPGGRKT